MVGISAELSMVAADDNMWMIIGWEDRYLVKDFFGGRVHYLVVVVFLETTLITHLLPLNVIVTILHYTSHLQILIHNMAWISMAKIQHLVVIQLQILNQHLLSHRYYCMLYFWKVYITWSPHIDFSQNHINFSCFLL